jgi:3-hydroxyacyl-CoA dehydrogenase/enoyl-CoA hydratase/3-hydroxybutyryl-CoA epimerase
MLGSQKTIQYITQSKKTNSRTSFLKDSLVDEICSPEDDIVKLAKNWIITKGSRNNLGTTKDLKSLNSIGCWTNFGSH